MKAAIYNKSFWIAEIVPDILFRDIKLILEDSGFNIIKNIVHYFEPIGYTAIFLLAESHLAIHTFPEELKTYIELSSCNEEMYKKFIKIFTKHFAEMIYE
jgi:S-adenosylmethionine decarboxylase